MVPAISRTSPLIPQSFEKLIMIYLLKVDKETSEQIVDTQSNTDKSSSLSLHSLTRIKTRFIIILRKLHTQVGSH